MLQREVSLLMFPAGSAFSRKFQSLHSAYKRRDVCTDRISKDKNSEVTSAGSYITYNCVPYWLSSSIFEEICNISFQEL